MQPRFPILVFLAACGFAGVAFAQNTSTGGGFELQGGIVATPAGQAELPSAAEGAEPLVAAGSPMEAIVFYILAFVAAGTAFGCVLSVNIVRMAVCLFGTLGAVATLYFLMAANFLGAIQLIVYAGGTLVVIVFGIMLTAKSPWVRYVPKPIEAVAGGVVCLVLFGSLVTVFSLTDWGESNPNPHSYDVAHIGESLLTTYLVPFELASVLLLAVMIGAAFLARPERKG